MLIECGQVTPAIDQHACINRQDFELNHVVLSKPQRPVSQTAGLEVRLWRIVEALIGGKVEREAFRNKLIILRDPLRQFAVDCVCEE